MGLLAELGHPGGSGGVHVPGHVQAVPGQAGQRVGRRAAHRPAVGRRQLALVEAGAVEVDGFGGGGRSRVEADPQHGVGLQPSQHLGDQVGGVGRVDQGGLGPGQHQSQPAGQEAVGGGADHRHPAASAHPGLGQAPDRGHGPVRGLAEGEPGPGHAEGGAGPPLGPVQNKLGQVPHARSSPTGSARSDPSSGFSEQRLSLYDNGCSENQGANPGAGPDGCVEGLTPGPRRFRSAAPGGLRSCAAPPGTRRPPATPSCRAEAGRSRCRCRGRGRR